MTFKPNPIPLLEYDPNPRSVINPEDFAHRFPTLPEHCVMCFFQDVIQNLVKGSEVEKLFDLGSEIGPNPVYQLDYEGKKVAFTHAGVGAPLSGAFLDELIGFGSKKFIACGGAGVIETGSEMGSLYLPTGAIRDEGMSYHYLPADQPAVPHSAGLAAIESILADRGVPYKKGLTWTTDAFYRETKDKVEHRRNQGCLTVEMEAAAFFAIAEFRQVTFAQILYGGDDVSSEVWDNRSWHGASSIREKLFWLAVESVCRL
ncbi:MAG: nucleoside phosphorylase [Chloroflexota bacterium]